ncbi:MAG: MBL fold metallo-hydrolase [Pseudomonadota bacterium]
MKIIVHKGSKEIGGTCIQLSTINTTILLDAGYPLAEGSVPVDIKKIKTDAILISHPHQDHYGLIEQLGNDTKIWIGKTAVDLINASRLFLGKKSLEFNFNYIEKWKPFNIGDFIITPYLMDHSSVDAYAFLVEAEGKKLFYSGDFRAHGRKKTLFEKFIKNPPKDIDVLFMEGTMMQRSNERFPDENAVEKKIFDTIKDQKNISFISMSSQNIDRIAAAYRACKRSGKVFVVDAYTGWVLEKIKNISSSMPDIDWKEVRVYLLPKHYEGIKNNKEIFAKYSDKIFKNRIFKEELYNEPSKYLMFLKSCKDEFINNFKKDPKPNLIYSQWEGYIKRDDQSKSYKQLKKIIAEDKVNYIYAHTSGHAVLEDLKTFARALNPKMLVPIHTEYGIDFEDYFDNVCILEDNEILER